jgi:hypothetical protein
VVPIPKGAVQACRPLKNLTASRGQPEEPHRDTLTASLNGSGHLHGWGRDLA